MFGAGMAPVSSGAGMDREWRKDEYLILSLEIY